MSAERIKKIPKRSHVWDQLVRIEPGKGIFRKKTFHMGRRRAKDTDFYKTPRWKITMTRPFAIGRYPVTREEYDGFRSAMGRIWLDDDEDATGRWPAGFVSWGDAIAYCDWLSRITGELYRLPSEAEWEYCCRATSPYDYSWDPDWAPGRAAVGLPDRTDVGRYDPNLWGLFDMHGNVWEWCADPWHDRHTDRPRDGRVWLKNGNFYWHAARGGSYYEEGGRWSRASFRDRYVNDYRDSVMGFRIARTLSPELVSGTSRA